MRITYYINPIIAIIENVWNFCNSEIHARFQPVDSYQNWLKSYLIQAINFWIFNYGTRVTKWSIYCYIYFLISRVNLELEIHEIRNSDTSRYLWYYSDISGFVSIKGVVG